MKRKWRSGAARSRRSPSSLQTSWMSLGRECDASSSSRGIWSPISSATAASPPAASRSEPGGVWRLSEITTSTLPKDPASTLSRAMRSAWVPARRLWATSTVNTSLRRSAAVATTAADCFSAYGPDVDAKYRASTSPRSKPCMHSRAAATAIVTASFVKVGDGPLGLMRPILGFRTEPHSGHIGAVRDYPCHACSPLTGTLAGRITVAIRPGFPWARV